MTRSTYVVHVDRATNGPDVVTVTLTREDTGYAVILTNGYADDMITCLDVAEVYVDVTARDGVSAWSDTVTILAEPAKVTEPVECGHCAMWDRPCDCRTFAGRDEVTP